MHGFAKRTTRPPSTLIDNQRLDCTMTRPKHSKQQIMDCMEQATAPPESFWRDQEDAIIQTIRPGINTLSVWSWRAVAAAACLILAWWGISGDVTSLKFAPEQGRCITFACLLEQERTKQQEPLPLTDQELEQLEFWSSAFDNPDASFFEH